MAARAWDDTCRVAAGSSTACVGPSSASALAGLWEAVVGAAAVSVKVMVLATPLVDRPARRRAQACPEEKKSAESAVRPENEKLESVACPQTGRGQCQVRLGMEG